VAATRWRRVFASVSTWLEAAACELTHARAWTADRSRKNCRSCKDCSRVAGSWVRVGSVLYFGSSV